MLFRLLFILTFLINYASATYMSSEDAFRVNLSQVHNDKIDVHFSIAGGFDVYADKIKIKVNRSSTVKIGKAIFPEAIIEHSDIVGDLKVYQDTADILLPITDYADGNMVLDITFQGCKGLDYCFPAMSQTKTLILNNLNPNNNQTNLKKTIVSNIITSDVITKSITNIAKNTYVSDSQELSVTDKIRQFIQTTNSTSISSFFANSFGLVLLVFFLSGILLAFTPCVFPMFPILFTIINGGESTLKRSLTLSVSYVLGMASAYALAGVAAAKLGSNIQLLLQNNITNYILAILFIIFSLSLFGLFDIRLPASLQNKLSTQGKLKGSVFSTYLTGAISTLILSPCITAPIAGALIYIATTGNVLLGGMSLFVMGIGSGIPLLVIAVFGSRALPKNGIWMLVIKDILAFLMLAMSIYIATRNNTTNLMFILLGGLLLYCGVFFLLSNKYTALRVKRFFIIVNIILVTISVVILQNQFQTTVVVTQSSKQSANFITVATVAELNNELIKAKAQKKPVMLDFAASWCMACKELEGTTFKDNNILTLFQSFYLIQVNITNNDKNSAELQKIYNVVAPPSLVFIDKIGKILPEKTITGYINSTSLATVLMNII
jgi:thiol:disulfide interchange protein DsbD